MMAPKYERLRMLGVALDAAAHELDEPIDRVEVAGGNVVVGAGRRRLVMRCRYDDSYDHEGRPLLGGGHWSAERVEGPSAAAAGLLARLFRR